jgi:hypothetical protein
LRNILRRLGVLSAATLTTVTLGVGVAHAMPVPDFMDDGPDVTPVSTTDWRQTSDRFGDDDTIRDRHRPTPLVTFEQQCVRRGCLIRVLIDDGTRRFSCRPGVRTRGGDDEDRVRGREVDDSRLTRADSLSDWGHDFGDDDDDPTVSPQRSLRLRLICVRLAR